MKWILLTADHRSSPPHVATREFGDQETTAAFEAYGSASIEKESHEEVVLFCADSVDSLRQSHPRYFYTRSEMIESLRESLTSRPLTHRSDVHKRHVHAEAAGGD